MSNACSKKRGFTLVEALVVVAIMGILSGIGVASLRSAVANSRIKDAGINVTAFMQRAANEATRLNEKLCVVASGKSIKTYKGECNATGTQIDEMELESSNAFVSSKNCPDNVNRYLDNKVTLTPKIGVSPIPSGCFVIQYGSTDRFAASIKATTKFSMYYKLSYDSGSSWFEF